MDSLVPEYGGNLFNINDFEKRVRVNISDVRDEHSMRYLVQGQHYCSISRARQVIWIRCKILILIWKSTPKRKFSSGGLSQVQPDIKIIFASTRQIYGRPDYLPIDEKHPLRPVDVNGINKMAGEWYHILYNNVYAIRTCVLRLTNTYGPRMRVKDARQTFLGIWIRLLVENRPFEVWEGRQLRDFTYVDDAVRALLMVAASDEVNGQVFNLGGDCVISLRTLRIF